MAKRLSVLNRRHTRDLNSLSREEQSKRRAKSSARLSRRTKKRKANRA